MGGKHLVQIRIFKFLELYLFSADDEFSVITAQRFHRSLLHFSFYQNATRPEIRLAAFRLGAMFLLRLDSPRLRADLRRSEIEIAGDRKSDSSSTGDGDRPTHSRTAGRVRLVVRLFPPVRSF